MTAIDERVLGRLVDDLGRTSVNGLVATYLDALGERRQRLADAVAANDTTAARKVAHQLRSTSLLVGAISLGEACAWLEAVSDSGDVEGVHQAAGDVAAIAPAVARDLQVWLTT